MSDVDDLLTQAKDHYAAHNFNETLRICQQLKKATPQEIARPRPLAIGLERLFVVGDDPHRLVAIFTGLEALQLVEAQLTHLIDDVRVVGTQAA